MANEDLPLLWDQFLDCAMRGTKTGEIHTFRIGLCKTAVKISDILIESRYICADRYWLWSHHFKRVCETLAENDDVIKRIVREYFLCLHSGELRDFSIKFMEKEEGKSIGNICDVKFSGIDHRFYIKCHQRGPRSTSAIANRNASIVPPFVPEIFVYKLLSIIKVGGEVHFPFPITSDKEILETLYIATEEIKFTCAEELTLESANVNAIALVHFLQYILHLDDVGTNGNNYGQSDEGKPVIVDFWVIIKDDDHDYVLSDYEIDGFWDKRMNCNSRLISGVLRNVTTEKKKEIVHGAIKEWNLINKIDEAKSFVENFVTKNRDFLEFFGDLNRYVSDIKSNVESFLK